MDVVSKKWNPGAEPFMPTKQGMTEKHGATMRAVFAKDFVAALLAHPEVKVAESPDVDLVLDMAIHLADELILKLYPEPLSAKIKPVDEEKSACAHDGEVIFHANGTAQCMKCKNAVPMATLIARAKK